MNRQAQAVVLLLVGGAVLRASLTDLYLRYVKHGLRPLLIVAGSLLVVMAVMTLWYELRGRAATHDHGSDDGHGHSAEPRVAWLLILPVFALLLVAPPALGAYAASHAGTALAQPASEDFPPLPAGDPVKISMLDYASRAVFDQGKSIGTRRVEVSGVSPARQCPGDTHVVTAPAFRMEHLDVVLVSGSQVNQVRCRPLARAI